MSSNQEIGAPFTLATLPKPVGSTNGRTHAASVCSISGIKKRKRTEVVIGLDGEGIFVYSLQNPQLVTSYALPPSTTFTLAPLSIYRKGSSKIPSQRYTYASVSGTSQTDTPQLICFQEKSLGDRTEIAKTAYNPSNDAQVLALDALPVSAGGSTTSATHDVLATFRNGDLVCLSADLQVVRWVANLKSLAFNESSIDYISTATAKSVTRGFLRSREDIAAALGSASDDSSDLLDLTQIMCLIYRKANGITTLGLVHIQPRSPDLSTTPISPLKHLISWDLPAPVQSLGAAEPSSSSQYSIHASHGVLHVLSKTSLLSYNFSETVPNLYSELALPGSGVDSFLRLSQDVIFTTSSQICRVFDAKYNTLQALHSLEIASRTSDAASPAKMRKLTEIESDQRGESFDLVAYHADHDLVVAVRESEVIGMHINASFTRKRVKTKGILLSDALGKGVNVSSGDFKARELPSSQGRRAKLDRYVSKGKIGKFEEAFAADLGIELDTTHTQTKRDNEVNGGPLTNGVGPKISEEDAMAIDNQHEKDPEDELKTWKIPSVVSDARKQQSRQYALYALSKIFRSTEVDHTDSMSQNLLKIDFFPPNVFQWLLQTGHLSAASVRQAILEEATKDTQSLSLIADGDIVKALVDFDPDLHILSAILNDRGYLPIGEVVQAIKLLMQSLDEEAKAQDNTKLLTNGTAPSEEDIDLDFASELAAASHEIDHAMSVLDHGLLVRSHTLRPALIRLHSFAPRLITRTLRSLLSRQDLESLISVLHLEMRNEGWSSPYDSNNSDITATETINESPDDHAVAIIASLLSCTLDAIGAGAWLAGVGNPVESESSEDLIQSLHSDTSEALIGFFEARYMRGLLGEFLRYASNLPKSHKPSNESLEKQRKPFTVGKELGELPKLPLGARPDMGVERTKNGRGGKKEERSKREIGMLISQKVPKYSFERIVL